MIRGLLSGTAAQLVGDDVLVALGDFPQDQDQGLHLVGAIADDLLDLLDDLNQLVDMGPHHLAVLRGGVQNIQKHGCRGGAERTGVRRSRGVFKGRC